MKNGIPQTEAPIEVEVSSGNVFADLGLPNAEELLERSKVISEIHAVIRREHILDAKAARMLGMTPRQLDALLRGDVEDRYSLKKLRQYLALLLRPNARKKRMSMHDDLEKLREAATVFVHNKELAELKVQEINPVIERLCKSKLARKGGRVSSDIIEVWHHSESDTATYNVAAIQVPEGVGVLQYTLDLGEEPNEETIVCFTPFEKCEDSVKVNLLPCMDVLLAKLTRDLAAR